MSLERFEAFDARDFSGLPEDATVLAATDRLAKEKQQVASQWIDFEIVK